MTENRSTYKASKVKSFLFFLLLAMIFWTLAKFSTETSTLIETNITYTNVPEHVSVTSGNPNTLSFELVTNGFEALSYGFKQPTLAVDVSRYYQEGDSLIELNNADLVKLIASQLDHGSGVNNLSSNSLRIALDRLATRKVPVQLMAEIDYKEGYRNLGTITIQPDSVVVMGPEMQVAQIQYIATENIVVKNASDHIERKAKLQQPEGQELSITTEEVVISMEVEEFTQKEFQVSVQLINAPKDIQVKLLPSEIGVSFSVAMSRFNSVSPNDFTLVCDYQKRNENESYLVPSLEGFPQHLYDIELTTKRVEYLIFK